MHLIHQILPKAVDPTSKSRLELTEKIIEGWKMLASSIAEKDG